MEKQIQLSETRQFRAIFPNTLNSSETLFGGQVLQWMDEVAFITATRFIHQHMFTVDIENVGFLKVIPADSIVEVVGRVEKAGSVRIRVRVEVYVEEMYSCRRDKAISGTFVFAALDEHNRPKRLDYSLIKK